MKPTASTLVPALLALIAHLVVATPITAADGATAPSANPMTPGVEPGPSPEQLLARLPTGAAVATRDGKVFWEAAEGSFEVVDVVSGDPVLATAIGRLAMVPDLLSAGRGNALATLRRLETLARNAGLSGADLRLSEGVMTGVHLRSPAVIVLPEGVLRKAGPAAAAPDRADDRAAVATQAGALTRELSGSAIDDLGRKTMADILARVPQSEGEFAGDEVTPAFARRVIRNGWLKGFFANTAVDDRLTEAVAAAETFKETVSYAGDDCRLAEVRDAYGQSGWILRTPRRSAYTRVHLKPMYHWAVPSDLHLVVDLPAGADPLARPTAIAGARLYQSSQHQSSQLLARWGAAGFSASRDAWRRAIPAGKRTGVSPNAVTDFIPPHLMVTDLRGDLVALFSAGGRLDAPRDGSTAEAERFLADAARALPDAPHLDLVGEYFLSYVYDSPDSRFPYLIGNKQVKGDIHQTAVQTLATAAGGMCRGDCDDLAELYQTIAERQGRTAHVIALPGHAACAWADKQADGKWHVYVLQTGPALEFTHERLPDALAAAYKSFDETDTFDANGLSLLLRFSRENTRGSWRLSYRIFAEPEYARTMIDVQRDWHYQTYQRGIAKMEKLIADGDTDNANYRELSGLYSFTGQHGLAADFHAKALERTDDPLSRFYSSVELVNHFYDAGRGDQARAIVLRMLDEDLPTLKDRLGQSVVQVGFSLALTTAKNHANDLAVKTLDRTVLKTLPTQIERIAEWLASSEFDQAKWDQSQRFQQMRQLMQMYAGTGIEVLKGATPDALPRDPALQTVARSVQRWLNDIAFRDIEEPGDAMTRYAAAGAFYAAALGEDRFTSLVEAADPPKPVTEGKPADHSQRIGGLAQLHLDLPWIKASVPYWSGRLNELFEKERTTLDAKQVARYGAHLAAALAASRDLGVEDTHADIQGHQSSLIVALVTRDEKVLRERLRHMVDKNDKRLRELTATTMGDCARFLPMDWFKQVIRVWDEELAGERNREARKSKYFLIAWRAALNGGTEQALEAAFSARTQFSDEPAFDEEYRFMQKLFKPVQK